jgi:uncharacterized membrane protein YfcA
VEDDDFERLLREIDGVTGSGTAGPGAQPPAKRQESLPETRIGGSGQAMALAVSAVIGVVGVLLGWLPGVPGLWLGLGGFLGAYIAFTISRRYG